MRLVRSWRTTICYGPSWSLMCSLQMFIYVSKQKRVCGSRVCGSRVGGARVGGARVGLVHEQATVCIYLQRLRERKKKRDKENDSEMCVCV